MASQADISAALQRAGVTVYGLQVMGDRVSGTVGSEADRQKAYAAVAQVDNSANLSIQINEGFAAQESASAATGSRGASGGRTYTVKSGDSLSKIAKEVYGDASDWKKIHEANRSTVPNPDLIHPGQQLVIP